MSITNGYNIVIYQDKNVAASHLLENLQQMGAAVQLIMQLSEAEEILGRLYPAALVVNFGSRRSDAEQVVALLASNRTLQRHPLLLLGKGASAFEDRIGQHFAASMTLSLPYTHTELSDALTYITRQAPSQVVSDENFTTSETAGPDSAAVETAVIEAPSDIPQILFSQLAQLKLPSGSLEGDKYFRRINEDSLRERGFLVEDERIVSVIHKVCYEAGAWGAAHLYRLSFLSGKITQALQLDQEVQRSAHIAAFLFPWSFAGRDQALLRAYYIKPGSKALRKDLCSQVKDSAMKIAMEIKLEQTAQITSTLAKLIGQEDVVHDDPISIAASAIMGADLVDRACFPRGAWDPRAAYTLLRNLKAGAVDGLHPLVLCCIVKFLTETISAQPAALLLSKKLRNNPDLKAAREQAQAAEVAENERKVGVASLEPGMKLTKPLVAYDGKEILSSDLVLDHDLIWRLWQLSAIRPMNAPLVVAAEN